jgi:hypothetical protein
MTIEFELESLTDKGRMLLLQRANQWQCTPAQAMARILEAAAKKAKLPNPNEKEAA